MYVSYINDFGHRNNYFYMQVLQGSSVGNKQLLQTCEINKWNEMKWNERCQQRQTVNTIIHITPETFRQTDRPTDRQTDWI